METRTQARLVDHEIIELAAMLRDGRTTSVALTEAYLERIDRYNGPFDTYDANGGYNAFVRVDRDGALAQAREVDTLLAAGIALPPLAGIPIGIKDSIAIEGRLSTNGFGYPEEASVTLGTSPFDGNAAVEDAEVVAKLRKQKAVLIGHTTCSELSGNINGLFAGNAWDMRFACGGSSQGSGVAPIARLSAAAIGVETGGSIITPAAANGASSIKPAPGRVSASGIMQGQAGMDVPGPMARSMRDAALILNAIYDTRSNPNDPLGAPSIASIVPTTPSASDQPLRGLRIGYPINDPMVVDGYADARPTYDTYEAEHRAAYDRFREQLVSLGAEVVDFEIVTDDREVADPLGPIPGTDIDVNAQLVAYTYNAAMFNQAQEQQRFAGSRPEEQAAYLAPALFIGSLIIERTPLIDTDLKVRAEKGRSRWRQRFQEALDAAGVDVMVGLPLGARVRSRFHQNYLPVRRAAIATPNLLAWPAAIFPIGMTEASIGPDGGIPPLPISAMLWAPAFNEALMIQAAIDFQHHFPTYHTEIPPDPTIDVMRDSVRPAGVPRVWPVQPDEVNGIPGIVPTP